MEIRHLFALLVIFIIIFSITNVMTYEDPIKVNYDIGRYKYLDVGETFITTCENTHNNDPPSWTYPARLFNDHRMKIYFEDGKSRMEIKNTTADDAGKYGCGIDYVYEGRTIQINKSIEVIVNKIYKVTKEVTEEGIKLLCDVHAYPAPTIFWKIDYDNKELNPKPEEPDRDDDYWVPPETKVVVDKTEGRWTLRQYNGVNNAELFISSVTKDDDGTYFCFAQNIAGDACEDCTVRRKREEIEVTSEEKTTTIIIGKPVEPTNISITPRASIPDARKGDFEATSCVSAINIACLVGILLGNTMLGYIIYLIVRGNRIRKEYQTNDIESRDSVSTLLSKDDEVCNEVESQHARKSVTGMLPNNMKYAADNLGKKANEIPFFSPSIGKENDNFSESKSESNVCNETETMTNDKKYTDKHFT